MIAELVSRVFGARDIAHRAHLASDSYAEHVALGEFYEQIIGAVDEIAEVYQGAFGKIGNFEVKTFKVESIVDFIRNEAEWMEDNREELSNNSNTVENLIDQLASVYMRTVYKLENLH